MLTEKILMKYLFGCKIYILPVLLLLIFMGLGLSCSDLYFSDGSNCVRNSEGHCLHRGDTAFLYKEPMDLLIVLDNSHKAKDLNPHITANLNQFLQCIKPIDWKVGLISGVYNRGESENFGQLMRMEVNGLQSSQNSLNQHRDSYSRIFNDTISLQSGCSAPPFCYQGKLQPLSAVKSFMESSQKNTFLREQTPLAVMIVSSSEKQKKPVFANKPASSQELLSVLQPGYYGHFDHFMSMAALPPGTHEDCVRTAGDIVSGGAKAVSQIGQTYAMSSADPGAWLFSVILGDILNLFRNRGKTYEIAQFVKETGGQVVDLCSPHFGKALAYLLFQKLNVPDKFPDECRIISQNGEFIKR